MTDRAFRVIITHLPSYVFIHLIVVLAATFTVTSLTVDAYAHTLVSSASDRRFGQASVQVIPDDSSPLALHSLEHQLDALSTSGTVYAYNPIDAQVTRTSGSTPIKIVGTAPANFRFYRFIDGREPLEKNEIALSAKLSSQLQLTVGSTLTITVHYRTNNQSERQSFSTAVRLTGIYRMGLNTFTGQDNLVFMPSQTVQQWGKLAHIADEDNFASLFLTTAPGQSDIALLNDLDALDGLTVVSRSSLTPFSLDEQSFPTSFIHLGSLASIFAICLISALSVRLIFNSILTQRRNEYTTMRGMGISRRKISAMVRAESLLVGLLSATTGALLGAFLAPLIPTFLRKIGSNTLPIMPQLRFSNVLVAFFMAVAITLWAGTSARKHMSDEKHTPNPAGPLSLLVLVSVLASCGSAVILPSANFLREHINHEYPFDISVHSSSQNSDTMPLSEQDVAILTRIEGVQKVIPAISDFLDFQLDNVDILNVYAVDKSSSIPELREGRILLPNAMQPLVKTPTLSFPTDTQIHSSTKSWTAGTKTDINSTETNSGDTGSSHTDSAGTDAAMTHPSVLAANAPAANASAEPSGSSANISVKGSLKEADSVNITAGSASSYAKRKDEPSPLSSSMVELTIVYTNVKNPVLTTADLQRITGRVSTTHEAWLQVDPHADYSAIVQDISDRSSLLSPGLTISSDMLRSKEALLSAMRSSLWLTIGQWLIMLVLASMSTATFLIPSLKNKQAELSLRYALGQGRRTLVTHASRLLTLRSFEYIIVAYVVSAAAGFFFCRFFGPPVFRGHTPDFPWALVSLMLTTQLFTVFIAHLRATSNFLRTCPEFFNLRTIPREEFT